MAKGTWLMNLCHQPWTALVPVLVRIPLLGRPAQLVELAIGTPRFGIESGRARHREHVAMTAALGAVFGRTPPAARLESLYGGRFGRNVRGRLRRRGFRRRGLRHVEGIGHRTHSS